MENTELYLRYNSMQRADAKEFMDEFFPRMSWNSKGEKVLDVGSGPGDFTAETLLPLLPVSASLIGIDKCMAMVEKANNVYSSSRLRFSLFDFSSKEIKHHLLIQNSFSKLFSFFCFHWIKDLEQVGKNIYSLLRPGAELFAVMAPTHQAFFIYKKLAILEEWKKYTEDIEDVVPLLYYSQTPCEDLRKLWTRQGLEIETCEKRTKIFTFKNMTELLGTYEAIDPFVRRMDQDVKTEYMATYKKIIKDFKLVSSEPSGKIVLQNEYIVIHGRHPQHV